MISINENIKTKSKINVTLLETFFFTNSTTKFTELAHMNVCRGNRTDKLQMVKIQGVDLRHPKCFKGKKTS